MRLNDLRFGKDVVNGGKLRFGFNFEKETDLSFSRPDTSGAGFSCGRFTKSRNSTFGNVSDRRGI